MHPQSPDLSPLTCSVARTPEDLDAVFRLRYGCYRRSGAIAGRSDERFSDGFDELPNQFSFLLRAGEEPLATVRISVVRPDLHWSESPSRHVFGDHPAFQPMAANAFVEASRLCFGRQARRDMFYGLLGNMAAMAELFRVEWLVACPRVEHAHIYQRLYGFEPLAAPRKYFGVNFETGLLGTRLNEIRRRADGVPWMDRAWAAAQGNLKIGFAGANF